MATQTPKSTQLNAAKRSAADDIIEAKVKGAVDAYQRGQYRSIRAAATAYDAPYHRTRSRCQGHHSRGQNGGNSTSHNGEGPDQSPHPEPLSPSSSRRNRKVRGPGPGPGQQLSSTNPADPAGPDALVRQRKPGAPSESPSSSTNDLLRELLKRLDRHEAPVRAGSPSLEIIEQVSTHMVQQEGRISRLENEISEMRAGITEQAKEIKLLRQCLCDRFDTLRGDVRLLRKTLDNGISN